MIQAQERINEPVMEVRHADLARFGTSHHTSDCPVCGEGVLPMTRDPRTMLLLNTDHCTWCGQQFLYTDVPDNTLATLAGTT